MIELKNTVTKLVNLNVNQQKIEDEQMQRKLKPKEVSEQWPDGQNTILLSITHCNIDKDSSETEDKTKTKTKTEEATKKVSKEQQQQQQEGRSGDGVSWTSSITRDKTP